MDPALMFGMVNDQDEDEDYDMDLSGWMSRSPPEGIGNIMGDEPMITSRPRGGGATDPNAMASAISAPAESYTYRPRSNPSNLGYTVNQNGKFQTPANPLYAHDESRIFGFVGPEMPQAVAGIKTAALLTLAGSALYYRGFPGRRIGTVAALAYLHPVIGWNHGYWNQYGSASGAWGYLSTAGKAVAHLGALYVGYRRIRT